MRRNWIGVLTAAAILAMPIALPQAAAAQDTGFRQAQFQTVNFRGGHRRFGGHRGFNNRRFHNRGGRAFRGGFNNRRGFAYRRGYNRGFYHGRRRGGGGRVLLGVGAGLLAADLLHRHHHRSDPVIIRERIVVPQDNTVFRSAPRPQANQGFSSGFEAGQCEQIREYQTVVIVGGKEVDAYGEACLQPDGSWLQGPVQLPPQD